MLERIVHYYTKIKQIGLVRFYCAARARIKKSYFSKKMIPTVLPPFSSLSSQSLPFTHTISMQRDDLLQYADAYACNQFSLLGSDPKQYTHMPWYSDVRLQHSEHDSFDIKVPHYSVRPAVPAIAFSEGWDPSLNSGLKVLCMPVRHSFFERRRIEGFENFQKIVSFEEQNITKTFNLPKVFYIRPFDTLRHAQGERGGRIQDGDYSFDIKVPWELARFQYAPILAYASKQTKNDLYVRALKQQIISFLDAAPYLHGIHWSNPMEVAIRAINWIVAYQIVRDELQQDMHFHDRLVQSLWQHMHYIENNWEWYDGRTNNHYLSNLVGYAYLNWFFNDQKRFNYCFTQLCNELEWQIQDDGSSYEGSTAYHGFVTELFLHGFLIAQQMGKSITLAIHATLDRMLKFAKDTKALRIGDDDSGSLLHAGLYDCQMLAAYMKITTTDEQQEIKQYPHFGLSIIDHAPWKISFRHHAYHGRQPSAHFHEDVASITLTYNGRPILVDPGTYLYTGSKKWRNYFRSMGQHSTFYPVGWNQKKNDDLFALEISEADAQYEQHEQSIRTMHSLFGYPVSRTVQWSEHEILIQDDISHASDQMEWQFLCAPELTVQKSAAGWHIMQGDDCLLQMECDELVFEKRAAWASPVYGVKESAWALWARGQQGVGSVSIRFQISFPHRSP